MSRSRSAGGGGGHPGLALVVIAAAQLMVVLDSIYLSINGIIAGRAWEAR